MSGPSFPQPRTLAKKLREAAEALEAGRFYMVDANRHLKADLEDLGVGAQEYYDLIPRLVQAALDAGPDRCYRGGRPPQRSTKHDVVRNLEMWPFEVELPEFEFPIYFKFVLKPHPRTRETYYYHVDCHPSKKAT